MSSRQAFDWGALAGMLWMVGAIAAHWMITPIRHPQASGLETGAAVVQLVGGFGGGLWLYFRRRPSEATAAKHGPAML